MLSVQRSTGQQTPAIAQTSGVTPISASTLRNKMARLWSCLTYPCACDGLSKLHTSCWKVVTPTLEQRLQKHLDQIALKETAFKSITIPTITSPKMATDLQASSKQKKQEWMEAFNAAFKEAIKGIVAAKIDPTHLPKEIVYQLTEIIGRYGIALYANNDAPHPFQSSLDVLKTAILMQQYALGISDSCPDLSALEDIDQLHSKEEVRTHHRKLAEETLLCMISDVWAEKVDSLTQHQLLLIPTILRYTSGALGYLDQFDFTINGNLLCTAEAVLLQAKTNPAYDLVEINDSLAELFYNDLTGFTVVQMKRCKERGQDGWYEYSKNELARLWEESVALSKDPEKMRARCDNKRTFAEEMTPLEIVTLRQRAVERHLALPKERQNPGLLALGWNNLSHALAEIGEEIPAFKCAVRAMQLATDCRAKGINDTQFGGIDRNYLARCQKFIALQEKQNESLEAVAQNS